MKSQNGDAAMAFAQILKTEASAINWTTRRVRRLSRKLMVCFFFFILLASYLAGRIVGGHQDALWLTMPVIALVALLGGCSLFLWGRVNALRQTVGLRSGIISAAACAIDSAPLLPSEKPSVQEAINEIDLAMNGGRRFR